MTETLEQMVARHEGYREHIYLCTAGRRTIGYGYNLDAGMPEDEARVLLEYRLRKLRGELSRRLPYFATLSETRRDVLVSMAYQMGIDGLLGFRRMLSAVSLGQFDRAAYEMLDSKWARSDSPKRAEELAVMMKNGCR